jgi:hypothetical protein
MLGNQHLKLALRLRQPVSIQINARIRIEARSVPFSQIGRQADGFIA